MEISRGELEELRAKYMTMVRLREDNAGKTGGDPRSTLSALAARFPGALREIDELPMDVLSARLKALAAAEEDLSRVERWMAAMAAFHRLTRGALSAKRWLNGKKEVDAGLRAAFAAATVASEIPYPEDAQRWADDLHRIAAPPGGRITILVYERIGLSFGVSAAEAKTLVFGLTRAHRPAR